MREIISLFFDKESAQTLKGFLVKKSAGSFFLKIFGIAISFLSNMLLARFLNPEGFGLYTYVLAIIHILVIPTQRGFPQLTVRQIASYHAKENWSYLKGFIWRSNQFVLLITVLILIFVLCYFQFGSLPKNIDPTTLLYALPLLFLFPLNAIRQSALRGFKKIYISLIPEYFIKHGLLVIVVLLLFGLYGNEWFSPHKVMMLLVFTVFAGFIFGSLSLYYYLPHKVKDASKKYKSNKWLKSALPFMLLGGMEVINGKADIIILGFLSTPENVGIYQIALKGAEFVIFPLLAANLVLAPIFSELWTQNKISKLQKVVTKSARGIVIISILITIMFVFFGDFILDFFFGEEYSKGYLSLIILSFGYVINAGMGSVGTILQMTGFEKITAYGVGISSIINIVLNVLLIPTWGIEGAAIATGSSIIIWNIILYKMVKEKVGIKPSII